MIFVCPPLSLLWLKDHSQAETQHTFHFHSTTRCPHQTYTLAKTCLQSSYDMAFVRGVSKVAIICTNTPTIFALSSQQTVQSGHPYQKENLKLDSL